jgi:hypothetical protein
MRVEAIKTENGLFIPMSDSFREIHQEKILLDIEIVEPLQDDAYEALDQLIGLCATKRTDASLNHDAIIYGTNKQR